MRRWGKILFGVITTAMIGGTVLCANSSISQAVEENSAVGENLTFGEVYSTAVEEAYGDTFRSVYENRLAGSPLEAECADGVDTATGHLILSRSDLSLEGTGGMDFELSRYYDSNEANLGHATVEHVDELKRDTVWVEYTAEDGSKRELIVNTALLKNHKNALKNLIGARYKKGDVQHQDIIKPEKGTQRTKITSNKSHSVYGIASGWRYDFPWIETVTLAEKEGWEKRPAYLHYGSAGVISIRTGTDEAGRRYPIQGLEGYEYEDVKLEDWDKTVDGIACKYLLRDKTGLRTYFNENGVIVLQKDAHDNTIRYTYTGGIHFSKMNYASVSEQRSKNGGAYKTITRTEFRYDKHGNETQGKVYPSYSADGNKEAIQNDYTYNSLGQQTKKTVTLTSARRPQDNRAYTEEEITYDAFGNELTYTDENGLVTKTSYDAETGEETETISAVGTEYETKDKEYQSADGLKTMTVDEYGRVTIDIQDAFGNTIISKDEAAGTWTESIYDYGSETGDESNAEEDSETDTEKEETARLIEERTYPFEPDEKRFIINENGETVPNYYITGKGKDILSGSKHFYDNLGNETGSAEFTNGELDAAHCNAWSFSKSETEVTGEEDEAQTITMNYSKTLNPAKYQPQADAEGYYEQFNDAVLSETITRTVTDADGNTPAQTSTTIRGKNRVETATTYETDDFGRTTKESTVTRKQQDGKWLPAYETQTLSTYDDNGNVNRTEIKSRKEGETDWQTRTVKTDYDEKGQAIREYTPRGTKENVAARYEYDILGRMVQSEIPQGKKDGGITYQKTATEYDNTGNVTEKNEQMDGDRTAKTGYTYDKRGNLVMVKSCTEDGKAQYVQYVYDIQGNKVRQFTGMTAPLTLTVTEAAKDTKAGDTFTYAGKTYQLTVSGKKKTDDIRETKYEYDGKNQLVAFTDPEGRRETYTYDRNSNLTKTVDKNGNTRKSTYDYQNRLTEMVAKEKKTGKETKHTYTYNAYGDAATQDDTAFAYDDATGQVTKETTTLTKHKDVVKSYTYDSAGNKTAFAVKVGEDTKLSLKYIYDGESRLTSVSDETGNEIAAYRYDTDGNLSERTAAGAGLTTTYAYDYQNRLTDLKNQTGSAGVISQYTSEYLANGQKSKETSDVMDKEGKKSKKTAAYTYDLLGRIKKETKTGSEDISYTYDSNNNRKEMRIGNKVTAYKYNKNDELLRTDTLNTDTEKDKVVIYKNDKNGNQLATVNRYEIPNDRKDRPYIDIDVTLGDNRLNENAVNHYNALNQLTQTLTKNYKVSFTYDADGLRTSKTVNGEKTVFVWDGEQLVMELTESGKVKKRYIRGNDLIYADRGADNTSKELSQKQYYVTDPHGSVVQLTDETGNVIKTYEYDAFGNEVKPDSKDDNPFRYCGEYYDKETEEIYLRARYYQPELGRFLTRDTYTGGDDEPESLHLYTYCGNDGVNMVDPNGDNAFAVWSTGAGGLCAIDGPVPIGDIIYVMGLAISGIITVTSADNKAQTVVKPAPVPVPQKEVPEKSIDRKKIKEKEIQAIAKAAIQIKKRAKQHKKRYFELHMSKLPISKEMIAVIGKSITKAKAVSRLKSQKDTITWFGYNAKKIANLAGNGKTPFYHNDKKNLKSKRGCPQFRHYHPRGKRSHSAYVV